MGDFAELEKPEIVGRHYSRRVLLYLESKEDLEVLQQRWFNEGWQEWIEFRPVDDVEGGKGGSTQVYLRVYEDRYNKIPAYGIVDRDVLFNSRIMGGKADWDAFFNSDHVLFDASNYLGVYIKVLRRWEMENYLLHPRAMKKLLADSEIKNAPCSPDESTQCILDFSDNAILLTAANLVLINAGKEPLSPLFEQNKLKPDELKREILTQFRRKRLIVNETEIEKKISAIRAFLRDETEEPEARWNQLNHLIDGKLFLKRFCNWFGFKDPKRLDLASKIYDMDLIDPEIDQFMNNLKKEAVLL